MPKIESGAGIYTFKVTLGKIWRRIAISSEMTLWDLSRLILQAVDFDCDHLDMFQYKISLGALFKFLIPTPMILYIPMKLRLAIYL